MTSVVEGDRLARSLLNSEPMRCLGTIIGLLTILAGAASASPLGDTREAHALAKSDFSRLSSARSVLDQSYDALAGEIETLKASRSSQLGPATEDAALDERLKRGKGMAEELAELDRGVRRARRAYVEARSSLVTVLESEILRLQLSLSEVSREERQVRFETLRSLVDERRTLPALPVERRAPIELPPTLDDVVSSPEELRELVDETRDHAERVRAQLDQVNARVEALRARQRLLQAAMDFERDDALFAEGERNRRVVTETREGIATVGGPIRTAPPTPVEEAEAGPRAAEPDPAPQAGADPSEAGSPPADSPPADSPPARDSASERSDDDADGAEGDLTLNADDFAGEPPPALASPHQGVRDAEGGSERMIRLNDAFDPVMLEGEVDNLSPEGVELQIRALLARRAGLMKQRGELSTRRGDLERRAVDTD